MTIPSGFSFPDHGEEVTMGTNRILSFLAYLIIGELNWYQHLRSSVGSIMNLSVPTKWLFPDVHLMFLPQPITKRLSEPW